MSSIAADPDHALTADECRALPAMLTVAETARAVNINPYSAYRLIAAGEFPIEVVRLGRSMRCRKVDVLRFLGLTEDAPQTTDAAGLGPAASSERNAIPTGK